jgi:hypothetical protein
MLHGIDMRPDIPVRMPSPVSWIVGPAPGFDATRTCVTRGRRGVPSRYGADGSGWLRRSRAPGRGRSCRPFLDRKYI